MSQDGENAPAAVPKTEGIISLIVRDQTGGEVMFKVKKTTNLKKVMDKYCEKKALQKLHVRFLFDGRMCLDEMTPEDLEMEDGDCIDAMMHQVGGDMRRYNMRRYR